MAITLFFFLSSLQSVFPKAVPLNCVKHKARNLRNKLQKVQSSRGFVVNEREALKKSHGDIGFNWVIIHIQVFDQEVSIYDKKDLVCP